MLPAHCAERIDLRRKSKSFVRAGTWHITDMFPIGGQGQQRAVKSVRLNLSLLVLTSALSTFLSATGLWTCFIPRSPFSDMALDANDQPQNLQIKWIMTMPYEQCVKYWEQRCRRDGCDCAGKPCNIDVRKTLFCVQDTLTPGDSGGPAIVGGHEGHYHQIGMLGRENLFLRVSKFCSFIALSTYGENRCVQNV
ncbi:hypothetical protein L596_017712 [Steinernema carpocapsae]|uniref:Peptidase S1 domain-containing protein n=1 Tax=Steinernema carpocapsae TaxID=34508 RepID=A0A4U5N2G9_STECR|nr:hypothetical protein L596_017712 [Steinernema carpocapsae]